MFNLSTPGPQYDLLEKSNMASLVPLILPKRLQFLSSGNSGHSCLALKSKRYSASAPIHSHARTYIFPVPITHQALGQALRTPRPLSELALWFDFVGS